MLKRRTLATMSGATRSRFGASARTNAGMPIVSAVTSVRCRGRNGNGSWTMPIGHRHQRPVHRLGEEQLGDPLDVADHLAALGDHVGQHGEAVVEQHELGDRAGGVGPGPMATPTSASLSASTSLTPSPVIATVRPGTCRAPTIARFWWG